jgi:drug/metabolite transporter (DMT)-like permease
MWHVSRINRIVNNVNNSNKNPHQSSKNYLAVLGLLLGAVCWGIIWYPYRLMAESGVSGAASTFYTYCIATTFASIYCAKYWRSLFTLSPSIVVLGAVAGWTNLAYVLAVIDGEVMRVMLLFYLSPLWTLILAHFWLREKTQLTGYIAIAVSLLGAFIMLYEPSVSNLPLPRNTSEWLALSAGMGFSLTNVITRQSTHLSVQAKSFAVWVGVLLISLAYILLTKSNLPLPQSFNGTQWGIMLIATMLLVLATIVVQYGVTKMAATQASVIFVFELVVAAIASYFLANEMMSTNEGIGGSLIVTASIFAAFNHND